MKKHKKQKPNDEKSDQSQNIIAKFGSSIQNVTQIINNQVNEKIIKRLGLEQRVGFALVYGVVILTGIILFWALRSTLLPQGPKMMTGEFNIAITEFGQLEDNGFVQSSEKGRDLSATLYHRLEKEMENLPTNIVIQVWHNEMGSGVKLDALLDQSDTERAESAALLAEEINANVIIYGNIREDTHGFEFLPQFFVAELPDAGELVGVHQLGSEISIPGSTENIASTLQFNEKLSVRIKALTHFVIGLAWETVGQPDRALEQFYLAKDLEGWEDNEGKEILYLFIGREAGILWDRGEDRGDEMRSSMEKALALNPKYGRAYIGLGNYHRELVDRQYDIVRTLLYDENEDANSDFVLQAANQFHQHANQAIHNYNQALENLPTSSKSIVEAKVHISLGGLHNRQGGMLLLLQDYAMANGYFDLAIGQNETALSILENNDFRHLSLANLGIGAAYHQKAYTSNVIYNNEEDSQVFYKQALASYTACIELADQDKYDWFLQDFKEEQCVPGRQDVESKLAVIHNE